MPETSPALSPAAQHTQRSLALWNMIVPNRIVAIEYGETAIRVLHPTKGWRRISHKRLGLA